MSVKYITREGDSIDSVCQSYYGKTSGIVELVLEANKGLEDQPVLMPAGIEIQLPEVSATENSSTQTIRLWD